ncbi:MAG: DUF4340 domain-containing protein [Desulfobacterales bacterium]|nr:DUF4340 domain-containing protein [Desulfobacterales bacterium]
MKSKTLIILLVTVCLLGALAYYMIQGQQSASQSSEMGRLLIDQLSVNDIGAITIASTEDTVELKRTAEGWVVSNRYNFPVDFTKLSELVGKLQDLKIGRSFDVTPERLTRLELHSPVDAPTSDSPTAVRIIIQDTHANTMADLLLGKARQASSGSGGHYVRPAAQDKIYLVDKEFRFIKKKTDDWMNKQITDVDAEKIEQVRAYIPSQTDPVYILQRPAKSLAAKLIQPQFSQKIDAAKIDEVLRALSFFSVQDVADPNIDPAATGIDTSRRIEYQLYDGTIYSVYPGKSVDGKTDQYYLKIRADYRSPETGVASEPPSSESQKSSQEEIAKPDAAANAARLNQRIEPWTYIISDWEFKNLMTDPQALMAKEDKPGTDPDK